MMSEDKQWLFSPNILESDNEKLIRIPDYEEIWTTVFRMGSFKAVGLDGMPSLFF